MTFFQSRIVRCAIAGVSTFAWLTGCAVEAPPEDESAPSDETSEETGETSDPITGPSAQTYFTRGLVRLDFEQGGGCSGFLIGPNMVMTSAHCVYQNTDSGSYDGTSNGVRWGYLGARIVFKPNTDETMCFLQTCRDADGDVQYASLVAWWHPGFTGSGAGDDIAIITRGTGGAFSTRAGDPGDPAPRALATSDYMRIFAADDTSDDSMFMAGYGAYSDATSGSDPRMGTVLTESWSSTTIRAEYRNTSHWGNAICAGDSGGPIYYPRPLDGDRDYVAGIASRTSARDGACPEPGDKLYWTRIAPKVGSVVNVVQAWAGNPACSSYVSTTLNGDGRYFRCW
jgi:hypothetical protein